MRTTLMILICFCVLLSACSKKNIGSYANPKLTEASNINIFIADEAANSLVEAYPPGQTSIYLVPNKSDKVENTFAAILESKLRMQGFSIVQDSQSNAIKVSYILDIIKENEGAYYLRLTDSKGFNFSRVYLGSEAISGHIQSISIKDE